MKLLHSSFFLFSHIALPILCIEFLLYFVVVATFALLAGVYKQGETSSLSSSSSSPWLSKPGVSSSVVVLWPLYC